ncbi:G patch domain-containing protein 11-like [Mya arenaria]|uniref:G patch domain-containing protein 11-like n=1 Tax=Mya arenaria TaxID=6604 RepID=UPI0022E076CD|nr:G patch domain-containing protein 11-like [Mya arenaria]
MSDDEADYMSDAFLKQIPDTRPSLVPKHVARRLQNERREKIANEKNKQKPKTVLEKEKRDEGLQSAISENNKGFALLQKMGYKPGMALGKFGEGRKEPVQVELKTGRGGLGREQDQKRKQEQRMVWRKHQSAKKQRMDSERKQTFVKRMNEKIATRNVGKDLYNSQKVCEQLDSQLGITSPNEAFFWPEALLPKTNDTDECPDTLESLEAGYSGYVQDEVEEEELGHEAEGSEGDEDDPYANFTVEEKLDVLTLYLRTKHKYCIWCGIKYNDNEDLMQNCPGNSAELHEDL